jgi:hypothetical protein
MLRTKDIAPVVVRNCLAAKKKMLIEAKTNQKDNQLLSHRPVHLLGVITWNAEYGYVCWTYFLTGRLDNVDAQNSVWEQGERLLSRFGRL